MTVGDLMKELQPLDPDLEVVVSERHRMAFSKRSVRDVRDVAGVRLEELGVISCLNVTFYSDAGARVPRCVVFTQGEECGLLPARSA